MASDQGESLLFGTFRRISKKRLTSNVELSKTNLSYFSKDSNGTIIDEGLLQTSDIIGCRCEKPTDSSSVKNDSSTWLTVFAYPFKKKVFSSKKSRHRVCWTFEIKLSEDFEENSKLAEKWMNAINCLARDIKMTAQDVETCVAPVRSKLLILINPKSGPGKALSIFKLEVLPMLLEANIHHKVVVTDHSGHAGELMKSLVLTEWYGVVIVSGDGLVYEVINGLMSRDDWQNAIKLPVGCLPGGSGNALCCSINYAAGEPVLHDIVLHSTFILIKHRVIPMDLVFMQTPSKNIYSFLSLTYGLMADVDYESEKYRSIGEARFAVGALKKIIGLRNYKARLSFLPVAEYTPKTSRREIGSKESKKVTKLRRFSLRSRSSSKSTISSQESIEGLNSASKYQDQNTSNGDPELQNGVSGSEDNLSDNEESNIPPKPDLNKNYNQYGGKVKRETDILTTASESNQIEQEVIIATKHSGKSIPSPLLLPLDEPTPDNWVVIEDEFVTLAAIYQTHLGSDMLAAPDAHINDGFIYLLFIRQGVTRNAMLSLFMSFGEGTHVDSPDVEMVRCLAFRLEPETSEGVIMVDGEKLTPCPIQGQVLPGLAKLMAIK